MTNLSSVEADGDLIRDLRVRRGLTQLQLAELATVSERTIRTAEKNQRISSSHLAFIADALGVPAVRISRLAAQFPWREEGEVPALYRCWEHMFAHCPAENFRSLLHSDAEVHSCGELVSFPHSESFFRTYAGFEEGEHFFSQLSDYVNSIRPINLRIVELCRSESATALQGTISAQVACTPLVIQLTSIAVLKDGRIQTLVNHLTSLVDGRHDPRQRSPSPPLWSDQGTRQTDFTHFLSNSTRSKPRWPR
jgi:transcriptional regulator with XRE-family HTH domain